MKVVLTGATGLIGRRLTVELMRSGCEVFALSRSATNLPELPAENVFTWSAHQIPASEIFKNCDAVIHLAGEGIADAMWTAARKDKLRDSRIIGTTNIVQAIAQLPHEMRPKTFISGSAIGIYGNSSDGQDENSAPGKGFLAELCTEWEATASQCEKLGLRTVILRTGLVLASDGGFLKKSPPVVLGNGTQWMSWIHIDDVVRFILFAANHQSVKGLFNLTAPNPVTNKEFAKKVARLKGFPFTVSIPQTFIKILTGELSKLILANQKILPSRATAAAFKFKFENIDHALNNLIPRSSFFKTSFSTHQFVPLKRNAVFSFFSKAENLETLTPPWVNFKITNKSSPEIKKGSLINYKLKIRGVPVKWQTLIKEWNPDHSFVDVQLKGPYRMWNHLHTFEDVPGGTLISDDVSFEIPGWIFGKLFLPLVKKDVLAIFSYRQNRIRELTATDTLSNFHP